MSVVASAAAIGNPVAPGGLFGESNVHVGDADEIDIGHPRQDAQMLPAERARAGHDQPHPIDHSNTTPPTSIPANRPS